MDSVYRQQIWVAHGPLPGPIMQEMDYSNYPHPPSFTSPPATPMTPVTPHHTTFVPQQYEHQLPPPPVTYTSPAPPTLPPPPDYRLYALCEHLQNYSQVSDPELKLWWDSFMLEFFHENATLAIEVDLGEGLRKFCLTRQWVVWYFKSLMESGVTSIHLRLGQCIHTFHHSMQQLEGRNATMETEHATPHPTKVCTNGALIVDFTLEEKPRIISWYFRIKDHVEFIPRSCLSQKDDDPGLASNITCQGILPAIQKFLIDASMMESGLQESPAHIMPVTTAPTTADISCSSAWQDPGMLSAGLDHGNLSAISPITTQPLLPPTSTLAQPHPQPPLLIPHLSPDGSSGGATPTTSSNGGGASRSSKSGRSCPKKSSSRTSPTTKRNQFVLVAEAALPLTAAEDMLQGLMGTEERTITRVDNSSKPKPEPAPCSNMEPCSRAAAQAGNQDVMMSSLHHPIWPTEGLSVLDISGTR